VDTLIIIPNQNLFRIANENTTFQEAFAMADEVLHSGVRGVTDLITSPGLVNLDFADIETVMGEKGKAMMGTGEASGEDRAIKAAELAIANPLLDQGSMRGATGVLINITGGKDMTLYEVDSAANRIREEVGDHDANIIFGSTFNPELEGVIRVSVVATGIGQQARAALKDQENIAENLRDHKQMEGTENSVINIANDEIIEDYELPSYNGYEYEASDEEGEDVVRVKHNDIDEQGEERLERLYPSEEPYAQKQQPQRSFLRRMWNSLKMSEEQDEEQYVQKQQPNVMPVADSPSDVRDIPEFFRKDR
jgi:cell division protein FtsZ